MESRKAVAVGDEARLEDSRLYMPYEGPAKKKAISSQSFEARMLKFGHKVGLGGPHPQLEIWHDRPITSRVRIKKPMKLGSSISRFLWARSTSNLVCGYTPPI